MLPRVRFHIKRILLLLLPTDKNIQRSSNQCTFLFEKVLSSYYYKYGTCPWNDYQKQRQRQPQQQTWVQDHHDHILDLSRNLSLLGFTASGPWQLRRMDTCSLVTVLYKICFASAVLGAISKSAQNGICQVLAACSKCRN